jgi:hypothetical protein
LSDAIVVSPVACAGDTMSDAYAVLWGGFTRTTSQKASSSSLSDEAMIDF